MPSDVFLCFYYGDMKMQITRKTERQMITETKRNKTQPNEKAHIHVLSLHIYCVLINLMANNKSTDVYIPLLNLNGVLRNK